MNAEAQVKLATYQEAKESGYLSIFEIARDYAFYLPDGDYVKVNPFPANVSDSKYTNDLRYYWQSGAYAGKLLAKNREEDEPPQPEQVETPEFKAWKDECVRAAFGFIMALRQNAPASAASIFEMLRQAEAMTEQFQSVGVPPTPANPTPDPEYID